MGLREKARKSLETHEEELDAPVLLKVDAAEREEAKAREAQLRKDLEDARKLSDAKTAQIARHDDTIHGLQSRVEELDATNRDVKEAQREIESSRTRLEAREAELVETRKALRDHADKRTAELEKDLEDARKDLAKMLRNLELARGETQSARREGKDREAALTTELTKAQNAAEQGKD